MDVICCLCISYFSLKIEVLGMTVLIDLCTHFYLVNQSLWLWFKFPKIALVKALGKIRKVNISVTIVK